MDLFKRNRELITRLYEEEGMTAAQLSRELETNHGFPRTNFKTFEKRLRSLGLRKKLKKGDWRIVYSHLCARDPAKASSVFIHGIEIPRDKVWKEIRRNRAHFQEVEPSDILVPLPDGVEISTPLSSEPAIFSPANVEAPANGSIKTADDNFAPTTLSDDALFGGFDPPTNPNCYQGSRPRASTSCSVSHSGSVTEWSPSQVGFLSGGISRGCLEFCLDNYEIPWRQVESWISRLINPGPHHTLAHARGQSPLDRMTACLTLGTMNDMELQRYGARVQRDALDGGLKIQYSFESLGSRSVFRDAFPAQAKDRAPGRSPLISQQGGFEDFDFLARLLYQLSNRMLALFKKNDIHRFLQTILARFSATFLTTLFQVDLPTINAAWQVLTEYAVRTDNLDIYRYLIRIGPSLSSWSDSTLKSQFLMAINLSAADVAARILRYSISSQRLVDLYKLVKQAELDCMDWSLEASLHCVQIFLKYSTGARTTQNWATSALSLLLRNVRSTLHNEGSAELKTYIRLVRALLEQGADVDAPGLQTEPTKVYYPLELWCSPEVARKLASWKTLLDSSYFIGPQLHDILYKFTKFPPDAVRFADAIRAARRGKDQFLDYLDSRRFSCPEEKVWFLEVVIDEFVSRPCPTEISYEVWEAALATGVRPDLSTIRTKSREFTFEEIEAWTPLYKLVQTAKRVGVNDAFLHLISLFIGRGAVPGAPTLSLAIEPNLLKFFAERGVSINKAGPKGVCLAAALGDYETVDLLYSVGFDIEAHKPQMRYLEDLICVGRYTRADLSVPTQEMVDYVWSLHTALRLPASTKAHELFYLILGTIRIPASNEEFANRLERCKHLVSISGLNLEYQPIAYYHTLLEAVAFEFKYISPRDSHSAIFNYLLEQGAPTSPDVLTVLIEAGAPEELISSMFEAGVDLMRPGVRITPLAASIRRGDLKLVQKLLYRGAKIDTTTNSNGQTLLQLACESLGWTPPTQAFEILQFLVNNGINVNSGEGALPIHVAAAEGHIAAVMFLLENGAEVNKVAIYQGETSGTTALDKAAIHGRLDVVQFLLNVGATSAHPGKSGYGGAIKIARRRGYSAVVELIRSHVEFIWGDEGTTMVYDDAPTCFR